MFEADHNCLPDLEDGKVVAQVDNPAHIAGMVAPAPQSRVLAGNMGFEVDSRVVAVPVQ